MVRPETPADAVGMLALVDGAMPLAGGTDLVIDLRTGRTTAEMLVDLTGIPDLAGIANDGATVRIGAMTTVRRLEQDLMLARRASAIVEAARVLGSVQVRNMATIGGNLCHATPSADLPPALLVHGAVATIIGPETERKAPVAHLFTGPGTTCLERDELLTEVMVPAPREGSGSCYLRHTVRRAMDLAGVGVAAWVALEDGAVTGARVALGAVAPVPTLVDGVDVPLIGHALDDPLLEVAANMAEAASSPITDARGTAAHRRRVVRALVPRALRIAAARAGGARPAGAPAPTGGLM